MEKLSKLHVFAGKEVRVTRGEHRGKTFKVQDYWHKLTGMSWVLGRGNKTCLEYGLRIDREGLPIDNEVLFGHIGSQPILMHVREVELEVTQEKLI